MKGKIKITVEETDDCGTFPMTETLEYTRDNTFEGVDEWVAVFKNILYCKGFHTDTIEEVFGEKEVSDKDIKEVSNKDDIIGAIPYIDEEKIDVEVEQ